MWLFGKGQRWYIGLGKKESEEEERERKKMAHWEITGGSGGLRASWKGGVLMCVARWEQEKKKQKRE